MLAGQLMVALGLLLWAQALNLDQAQQDPVLTEAFNQALVQAGADEVNLDSTMPWYRLARTTWSQDRKVVSLAPWLMARSTNRWFNRLREGLLLPIIVVHEGLRLQPPLKPAIGRIAGVYLEKLIRPQTYQYLIMSIQRILIYYNLEKNYPQNQTDIYSAVQKYLQTFPDANPLLKIKLENRILTLILNLPASPEMVQTWLNWLARWTLTQPGSLDPEQQNLTMAKAMRHLRQWKTLQAALRPRLIEPALKQLLAISKKGDQVPGYDPDELLNQLILISKIKGFESLYAIIQIIREFVDERGIRAQYYGIENLHVEIRRFIDVLKAVSPSRAVAVLRTYLALPVSVFTNGEPEVIEKRITRLIDRFKTLSQRIADPVAAAVVFSILRARLEKNAKAVKDYQPPGTIIKNMITMAGREKDQLFWALLKEEPTLENFEFDIYGQALNHSLQLAEYILDVVPEVSYKPAPPHLNLDYSLDLSSLPELNRKVLLEKCGVQQPLKLISVLGRRLIFQSEDGSGLDVKILKKGENPRLLVFECQQLLDKAVKFARLGCPRPVEVKSSPTQDRFLFKITMNELQTIDGSPQALSIRELVGQRQTFAASMGHPFDLAEEQERLVAVVKKIEPHSQYAEYMHYPYIQNEQQLFDAVYQAFGQLGDLAANDEIHITLADLFHNLRTNRPFVATYGIAQRGHSDKFRYTTGGLHWEKSIWAINLSGKGMVRDLKWLMPMAMIMQNLGLLGKNIDFIHTYFAENETNFYLLEFFSRYFLVVTLAIIKWHNQNPLKWRNMNWNEPESFSGLTNLMRKSFEIYFNNYLGPGHETFVKQTLGLIDWTLVARQMVFFGSHADMEYLEPRFGQNKQPESLQPEFPAVDIFGLPRKKVAFGTYYDKWEEGVGVKPGAGPLTLTGLISTTFLISALAIARKAYGQKKATHWAKRFIQLLEMTSQWVAKLNPWKAIGFKPTDKRGKKGDFNLLQGFMAVMLSGLMLGSSLSLVLHGQGLQWIFTMLLISGVSGLSLMVYGVQTAIALGLVIQARWLHLDRAPQDPKLTEAFNQPLVQAGADEVNLDSTMAWYRLARTAWSQGRKVVFLAPWLVARSD